MELLIPSRVKQKQRGLVKVRIEDAQAGDVMKTIGSLDSVKEIKPISNGFFEVLSNDLSCNKDIFNTCVKNKWIITQMISVEEKLEDVFRDLTT